MPDSTDEQLMLQYARTADEKSFSELVNRYTSRGVSFAAFILDDRIEAEDAVQEAYLRVVRGRRKFRKDGVFSAWFFTILRNVCLDTRRKKRPVPVETADIGLETPEHHEPSLLDLLSPADRGLLTLKLAHGYSLDDIAAISGCSPEAAKKRCQRALARLKRNAECGIRSVEE